MACGVGFWGLWRGGGGYGEGGLCGCDVEVVVVVELSGVGDGVVGVEASNADAVFEVGFA